MSRRFRQAPQPVQRTVFLLDSAYDAPSSFARLVALTSTYGELISSRWRKKNIALRSKCLSRAWTAAFGENPASNVEKEIPQRRTRLSEEIFKGATGDHNPLGSMSLDQYLVAKVINIEHLTPSAATLLGLLAARTSNSPGELGRWDYLTFVQDALDLFGKKDKAEDQQRELDIVLIGKGDHEYGFIKSWSPKSQDFHQGQITSNIVPLHPDGIQLMKLQKMLLDFCLNCVKDILSSELKDKEPDISINISSQTRKAAGALLLKDVTAAVPQPGSFTLSPAYFPPKTFNFDHAYNLAITLLRDAQDHISLLRTDATYLISQAEQLLDHRHERIPDMFGLLGNPYSVESVEDMLKKLLHNSYSRLLIWNEIVLLFEEAADLQFITNRAAGEVFFEKVISIKLLLHLLEDFYGTTIRLHAGAGPQLRNYIIRAQTTSFTGKMNFIWTSKPQNIYDKDPIAALLMCISNGGLDWQGQVFNLRRASDEIEQILAGNPELKQTVHPWMMNNLGSLASIYELLDAVELYHPTGLASPDAMVVVTSISKIINKLVKIWPNVDLHQMVKGDNGWTALKQVGTVEGGLDILWDIIDKEVAKHSEGGRTLEEWVSASKGRLAKKRRGKWTWQGHVWFAEGVEQEEDVPDISNLEIDDLPELIGITRYDDSLGYGEDTFLVTEFPPPPPPPVSQPPSTQPVPKSRLVRPPPPKFELSRPFGEAADGSYGAVPDPIVPPKVKVKTTKAGSEPNTTGPEAAPPAPGAVEEKPKHYISQRVYNLLTQLSGAVASVQWKDFLYIMQHLGFSVIPVGGSVVRFVPACETDEAINFHKPHPESSLSKQECHWTWKRLWRSYGWDMGRFAVRRKENTEE